ncbi:hypothetical protein GQ44DRAFT_767767 [Phaeosphaeriaceae sp. PMI808]|nr:hypothetical protein GQ44DRAFT_767767 [Phaeosphaeriaceae sp. PMI808]
MAVFLDLPPELLELTFHFLGSIDDVHHFGRVCKKTYDIFQRRNIYVEIMRSVIGQAPQHRYDLQLSKILDLHKTIVKHMQNSSGQLPATPSGLPGYDLNEWERALETATLPDECDTAYCMDCLPDDAIYDILARYQGLRVFENIWLKRQLDGSDYLSVDGSSNIDDLVNSYQSLVNRNELYRDGELASRRPKTPETNLYTALNADQRARFYTATISVWLLNEIRWVLTNLAYPAPFATQIQLLERCKKNITNRQRIPLLDDLDQLAIFKFMYHHLLPLYGTCLADRHIDELPFTFAFDFTKDPSHSSRLLQLFLSTGQTYLQPPDLIELIVRCQAARKPPYPLVTFPPTTRAMQRPSQARTFAFPPGANISLHVEGYKRAILQTSLAQLNVITRSSFHQTRHSTSRPVGMPLYGQLYNLNDYASYYFMDRALVAFELHESHKGKLRDIRDVFRGKWDDTLWSVWWWANSEEKARLKIGRWRMHVVSDDVEIQSSSS